MDNLTHTLTGVALSRAGLNRLAPHAGWILVLAANAADIDAVSLLSGPAAYLSYHRDFTHAIAFVPLVAILPLLVVRPFIRGNFGWKRSYLISLSGAAAHPVLDWLNTYGVRLWRPFSGEWHQASLVNVADLWIWAVLLVALLWPLLSRLVSSEIGARAGTGRGIAMFALVFLVLYPAFRYVLHERALAVLDARLHHGRTPLRVAAFPDFANPFRWVGLAEGGAFYVRYDLNLLAEFDPSQGQVYYKPEPGPAIEAARATAVFREFLRFSQYPYWRAVPVDEPEGAVLVEAMDLRFGPPSEPRFVAAALVRRDHRVERTWFRFR